MKQMEKKMIIKDNVVKNIFYEKKLLVTLVNAPFIVHLIYAFQTSEDLCMVVDFMSGGDLRYHLSRIQKFPEDHVRFYASQMVLALEHLHGRGIVHRDIKPDNLLLDEKGYCHLADFNISAKSIKNGLTGRSGTPRYMAPEIYLKKHYYEYVDLWSLGITLFEMFFGHTPFANNEEEITTKPLVFSTSANISEEAKSMIEGTFVFKAAPKRNLLPSDHLQPQVASLL
eukprot:TRINITY_DN789_c1_g1_i5.p1 TRINITY_DN789_c1_g1~~TRINITY_DN789_c1_g1_i5.p1  ORF type:complete len:227 (-),score=25.56 TRINITY_DN789_c1_g1_i5:907-1587(-)